MATQFWVATFIKGGEIVFRDCYFEYANVSSEMYNLKLHYIDNDFSKFDSGGKFETKTEQLPFIDEQLYIGKDYSANPLEFEIEIIDPDDIIQEDKMKEIKNWLFGQDGYKNLKLLDETQNYVLKCILEPEDDITCIGGYVGVRCKIVNASPFWYGEEKEITIDNTQLISQYSNTGDFFYIFKVEIPQNEAVDVEIKPIIIVDIDRVGYEKHSNSELFDLVNTGATSIAEGMAKTGSYYDYPAISRIAYDNSYLDVDNNVGYDSTSTDIVNINTRYTVLKSQRYPDLSLKIQINANISQLYSNPNLPKPVPIFSLHYGINILRIRSAKAYNSITFKYTPKYRMGAF